MPHQSIICAWWPPPADVPVRSCRRLLLRCSSRTEAQQMTNRIAEFRPIERVEMKLPRSEEHTSELQSLMRISYAVFCLKKKKNYDVTNINQHTNAPSLLRTQQHQCTA